MSSQPSSPAFQLFTSLRYDPLLLSSQENSRPDLNFITPSPFYMLTYHRDRMVEAAQHFDFDLVTAALADGKKLHEELLKRVKDWQDAEGKEDGPLKLRILFDRVGTMTVDFLPIPAVPLTTLYPPSFDPPHSTSQDHPAKKGSFTASPLTGGALNLGPTDSLLAGDKSQNTEEFKPSPLTGGALNLGPTDSLPAGDQTESKDDFKPSPLTGGALNLGPTDSLPAGDKSQNTNDSKPSNKPTPQQPPLWTLKLDTHPTPPTPHTLLKTTHRTPYDTSRARALPANAPSAVHREVILFNHVNEVTEGTLTSLYFFRGGKWVTPPVGVPEAFISSTTTTSTTTTSTSTTSTSPPTVPEPSSSPPNADEGELRHPFPGRWGHSVRSAKVGAGGQRGTSRRWALGKGFCMEEGVGVETVEEGEGVWVSNGVRGFGYGVVVGG